ncbi:MAG TPA: TetR-like C-terminal domain-containing protein [Tetragenococcus sp.]|nr:TetR-like C-terminal domain-containing protein [Tetragenococcus sp.]
MYTGDNPTALQSRKKIVKAMFSLLKQEDFSAITVKRLSQQAQLSRQTFYMIFKNREEVIEWGLKTIFKEYQQALSATQATKHQIIQLFFEFYQKHREIINALIDNHLENLLTKVSRECMEELNLLNKSNKYYIYGFISAGLTQLLTDWHRNEEEFPLAELASLTEELLGGDKLTD